MGQNKTSNLIANKDFIKYAGYFIDNPITISKVAKISGASNKTIYTHLDALKKLNYVGTDGLSNKDSLAYTHAKEHLYYIDISYIIDYLAKKMNLNKREVGQFRKIIMNPDIKKFILKDKRSLTAIFYAINMVINEFNTFVFWRERDNYWFSMKSGIERMKAMKEGIPYGFLSKYDLTDGEIARCSDAIMNLSQKDHEIYLKNELITSNKFREATKAIPKTYKPLISKYNKKYDDIFKNACKKYPEKMWPIHNKFVKSGLNYEITKAYYKNEIIIFQE